VVSTVLGAISDVRSDLIELSARRPDRKEVKRRVPLQLAIFSDVQLHAARVDRTNTAICVDYRSVAKAILTSNAGRYRSVIIICGTGGP